MIIAFEDGVSIEANTFYKIIAVNILSIIPFYNIDFIELLEKMKPSLTNNRF